MLLPKQTIKDVPIDGKTVLIRADYNVPLEEDGTIADDYRVKQSLATLHYLLEQNCKIVIISHLGRPDGEVNKKYSLEPVAQHLSNLIGKPVHFVPDCIGDRVAHSVKELGKGSIFLLENVRFYAEEEKNDEEFARKLARDSQANYFVQDGFGVVHRAHASTEAVTHYLPSLAGLLIEKEYTNLVQVRDHPKRPLVAVLGGAKISDKIQVVDDFVKKADKVIIGGAMANNFLKWEGYEVGKSKVEEDMEDTVGKIIHGVCGEHHNHQSCLRLNDRFILPQDVATAKSLDAGEPRVIKKVEDVESDDYILDLGDATIERIVNALQGVHTVLWNGTLGLAEHDNFAHGSARLALWLAQHKHETRSVIGGGDTADFALHWDGAHGQSFTHVSTGGGASLELLAGEKLPGVEALLDKSHSVRYTSEHKDVKLVSGHA